MEIEKAKSLEIARLLAFRGLMSGNNIYWLTSARKPLEIKGFRAFYILMKMTLQHFCNTQCEIYKKEWLQVAIKFI